MIRQQTKSDFRANNREIFFKVIFKPGRERPEPKVHVELLVKKGDAPASIVMRQHSPLLLGKLTSNLVSGILVTVTF
jgi:hypothetical protein